MVASLYFHIPFCSKKCHYCHFFVLKDNEEQKKLFSNALDIEYLEKKSALKNKQILSIYFGGGTPSKFPASFYQKWIDRLLNDLKLSDQCEITLEVNPEDVTKEKIKEYKLAGINRISMGVQSFDEKLLKALGRGHSAKEALSAIDNIQNAKIDNVTIDLMYDLPNQSLSSWKATVDTVKHLPIDHLSLYNLTFEKGAAFFRKQKELQKQLPDETVSLQMLEYASSQFEQFGLKRYEISAFAKENKESLHNTGYWEGRPFLGFGPSAYSYWGHARFQNVCNLKQYYDRLISGKSAVDFYEKLPKAKRILELFIIGIRMLKGINLEDFTKNIGNLSTKTQETLSKFAKLDLISQTKSCIKLTSTGTFFYDTIAIELI